MTELHASKERTKRLQRQRTTDSNGKQVVIKLGKNDLSKLQELSNCSSIPISILCRALLRQAVSRYSLADGLDDLLSQLGDTPLATPLSNRETDILNLLVHGVSNRDMASALELSEQTVKNHCWIDPA